MMMFAADNGAVVTDLRGHRAEWLMLAPGFLLTVIFAFGAHRAWRSGRRPAAYVLAALGAVVMLLALLYGVEEWAA